MDADPQDSKCELCGQRELCAECAGGSPIRGHIEEWPIGEATVVVTESEARRLVCAIEACRISDVIAIVKRQPWYKTMRAGLRTTRHLKPERYIEEAML